MTATASPLTPTRWVEICGLDDIPRLGSRVIAGPAGNIAVFRAAKDRLFALDDRCPHKGGPLSQGIVHGTHVACPLHNWQIALDSGEAVAPDVGCTRRYPVKAERGRVWLWLMMARVTPSFPLPALAGSDAVGPSCSSLAAA